MNEMYCTQCGHDPLLQADNDRRNREELEAAKAEIEYIRAMNLILSNQLGEARAKLESEEPAPFVQKLNTRIAELESAAQVRATPCKWSETDDGDWVTACGVDWVFTDGGPEDNDVRFCPCCGHPVELY